MANVVSDIAINLGRYIALGPKWEKVYLNIIRQVKLTGKTAVVFGPLGLVTDLLVLNNVKVEVSRIEQAYKYDSSFIKIVLKEEQNLTYEERVNFHYEDVNTFSLSGLVIPDYPKGTIFETNQMEAKMRAILSGHGRFNLNFRVVVNAGIRFLVGNQQFLCPQFKRKDFEFMAATMLGVQAVVESADLCPEIFTMDLISKQADTMIPKEVGVVKCFQKVDGIKQNLGDSDIISFRYRLYFEASDKVTLVAALNADGSEVGNCRQGTHDKFALKYFCTSDGEESVTMTHCKLENCGTKRPKELMFRFKTSVGIEDHIFMVQSHTESRAEVHQGFMGVFRGLIDNVAAIDKGIFLRTSTVVEKIVMVELFSNACMSPLDLPHCEEHPNKIIIDKRKKGGNYWETKFHICCLGYHGRNFRSRYLKLLVITEGGKMTTGPIYIISSRDEARIKRASEITKGPHFRNCTKLKLKGSIESVQNYLVSISSYACVIKGVDEGVELYYLKGEFAMIDYHCLRSKFGSVTYEALDIEQFRNVIDTSWWNQSCSEKWRVQVELMSTRDLMDLRNIINQ